MSEKVTYEELLGKAGSNTPFTARKAFIFGWNVWLGDGGFICFCDNEPEAQTIAHTLNEFPKLVEALEMADRMLRTQGVVCFKAEQALKDAKEVGR